MTATKLDLKLDDAEGRKQASPGLTASLAATLFAPKLFLLLMGILFAWAAAAAVRQPPNPDIAWALHAARSVLEGQRLYVDQIGVNPPLVFVLSIPAAWAAMVTGIDPLACFSVFVVLLALGSLVLSSRLLRTGGVFGEGPVRRALLVVLLVALMVVPGGDFGQREHVLLLGLVPYLLLAVLRTEGAAVSSGLAAAVGLFGALGFLLKPYFVPVWALVEAYVVLRVGIRRTLRRPEALIVAGLGLIYAVAVVALVPAYLESVRQIVAPLYPFYRPLPVAAILTAPAVVIGFVALGVVLLVRRPTAFVHLDRLLALSLAGMILSAAVQQKGFSYHFYPVLALSVVILGTTTLAVAARQARAGRPAPRRALVPVAVVFTGLFVVMATGRSALDGAAARRFDAATEPERRLITNADGPVLVLSAGVERAFPTVDRAGAVWAAPMPHLWAALSRFVYDRGWRPVVGGRPSEEAFAAAEGRVRRAYATQLARRDPALILVDTRPVATAMGTARLDFLAFLARDPCARNELARYDSTGMVNDFIVLHRRAPSSANATAGPCD